MDPGVFRAAAIVAGLRGYRGEIACVDGVLAFWLEAQRAGIGAL